MINLTEFIEAQPEKTFSTLLSFVVFIGSLLIIATLISFSILVFKEIYGKRMSVIKGSFMIAFSIALFISISFVAYILIPSIEVKEANKLKDAVNEAIDNNITKLLLDNEQKAKDGEMDVSEIEAYIIYNPEYFINSNLYKKTQLLSIENKIKNTVFKNYDRTNPVYKDLILNSKKMFQEW